MRSALDWCRAVIFCSTSGAGWTRASGLLLGILGTFLLFLFFLLFGMIGVGWLNNLQLRNCNESSLTSMCKMKNSSRSLATGTEQINSTSKDRVDPWYSGEWRWTLCQRSETSALYSEMLRLAVFSFWWRSTSPSHPIPPHKNPSASPLQPPPWNLYNQPSPSSFFVHANIGPDGIIHFRWKGTLLRTHIQVELDVCDNHF